MTARNPQERRLDRRIPLGCPALLRPRVGQPVMAQCLELSVGGMTLVTAYVPGAGEVLEVEIMPPQGSRTPALKAKVQVKRCHQAGVGRYELGVAIVQVLA
ncbi:MAG: PilZ domain-containing protein [Rhodocyclaceae bacterium]|nr:PilZ domain-containing protein [Rhodocyclaceae bacterium]